MKTIIPARRETQRPKLMLGEPGWFKSRGRIVYDPKRNNKKNTAEWMVMEVDREITRYFRWFIDRELMNITGVEGAGILQPSGDAHVSIIRGRGDLRYVPEHEKAALWGKYQGLEVDFLYSPVAKLAKGEFWFVDIKCPWLLEQRRDEFDLPHDFGFHLTVGKMRDHWIGQFDERLRNTHWNGKP